MKRLSGGQILLDITAISLGLTSGEVSISDAGVLGELTELRNFIDVNRDFSKGFKNLKPVLIEYRSSASKFNGIALANLSFNTDALHMSIGINTIQADGKMLIVTINVVYEWEDYIGYKVKSAKLTAYETLATGDGTFTGDVGVGGDLEVTGDASVGGDLEVTGDIEVGENSKVKILNNITDSDGHNRFMEDDITLNEITGVTGVYCKWSLSGTHLQIVIAGTIDEGVTLSSESLCQIMLPQWILDKIYPITGDVVVDQQFKAWGAEDYTTQDLGTDLTKPATNYLQVVASMPEATKDRVFRIAYDLLIDLE